MCKYNIYLHENFEKLIFLKLADKVRFHLNISFTMKTKLQTCISFRSNRRKMCLCYLLFYLVWWPRFLIIFPRNISVDFSWSTWNIHIKFKHKSQKNITELLIPKSQWVWKKKIGGMMLWIISGTFNVQYQVISTHVV